MEKAAVIGALLLYLDFINMFLFMLRLFGGRELTRSRALRQPDGIAPARAGAWRDRPRTQAGGCGPRPAGSGAANR